MAKPASRQIEVLRALRDIGGVGFNCDLPVDGSPQSIGGVLRHAEKAGLVSRRYPRTAFTGAEWRLLPEGYAFLVEAEQAAAQNRRTGR